MVGHFRRAAAEDTAAVCSASPKAVLVSAESGKRVRMSMDGQAVTDSVVGWEN